MDSKRATPSLPALVFLLSAVISAASLQAAELKLIKEGQIAVAGEASVSFLGRPRITDSGQGEFAPLAVQEPNSPPAVWHQGAIVPLEGIPSDARIFHYDAQGVGFVQTVWPDDEVTESTLTWQTADGRILWRLTHTFVEAIHVSIEARALFVVRRDMVNGSENSGGVYVYELDTGQSLNVLTSPAMGIERYVFSGDDQRLVFAYVVANSRPTEEDIINPHVNLACIDAHGRRLWDVRTKTVNNLSVSYDGNRVIYMTDFPHGKLEEKLGRKLYPKTGLIENGIILWEIDNPGRVRLDILPSGDYYYVSLSADQQAVSDVTTNQRPTQYCLFDASTHQVVWRKNLDTLVPQRKAGWHPRQGRRVSIDNQWAISVYSDRSRGAPRRENDASARSLIVLTNFLTGEIVAQRELPGEVDKTMISDDFRGLELLLSSRHRMLFEIAP